VIVLDTTILVYAKGSEHRLREPCRSLIEAIADGSVDATTTPEVIQEFVHVRARRRPRRDAVALGRAYAELLSPLLAVGEDELAAGLRLFERLPALGAFDAVLAATAVGTGADALVSADMTFSRIRGLRHAAPGSSAFDRLLLRD
jgi:predicted nucleic acid-binding protein